MNKDLKIWVTQTHPRALESAKDFEALGMTAIPIPVLNIEFSTSDILSPASDNLLIFTSRNGVRAFSAKHQNRHYDIVCVGDATASLARGIGFKNVTSVGGTSDDVVDWIKSNIPSSRPLYHCAGRHVRGQITETLQALGYNAQRIEYYASHPAQNVAVDSQDVDYVAVYSPLGAKRIAQLWADKDISHIKFLCMSEAVHNALNGLTQGPVLIAERPNQRELLNRLKLDLAERRGQI